MTSRTRRLIASFALALVVPMTASGCSEASPTPVATADVRWAQSGPSGGLEEDPWVRAVRAGELAYATAVNNSNFTDPSMASAWRDDDVRWFADTAARRLDEGRAFVVLGPRPFTPLGVDIEASGKKAIVVGCADAMAIDPPADDASPEPWPQAFEFRLERGPDGQRRITSASGLLEPYTLPTGEALTDEYCASVEIARGTFDPAPDPRALEELSGSDLVAPPKPSPTFAVEVPK